MLLTWLLYLHVVPDAQVVHPVQPCPPHCAYCAATQPPVPVDVVVVVGGFVEVDSVVGFVVVVVVVVVGLALDVGGGELPLVEDEGAGPEEAPLQDQTAGPGTV
jgi:hypothetical protein